MRAYLIEILQALKRLRKNIAKKVNIKPRVDKKGNKSSKVHAYLFRHSRGTALYKDREIGEALAKKFMGHAPDSKMAAVYNHLNDEDVLDAIKQKHNLEEEKKEKKN